MSLWDGIYDLGRKSDFGKMQAKLANEINTNAYYLINVSWGFLIEEHAQSEHQGQRSGLLEIEIMSAWKKDK